MATDRKTRWCERCWLNDKREVEAARHIDGEDLCVAHVKAEGYTVHDGTAIVPNAPPPKESTPIRAHDVLKEGKRREPEGARATAVQAPAAIAAKVARQPKPKLEPKKREPVKCADPECDKTFVPATRKSLYCSHRCYIRNWMRKHKIRAAENLGPRKCAFVGCEKTFTPHRKDHVFCSKACNHAYHNAGRKAKREQVRPRLPVHECEKCHKTFEPHRKDQRFCSRACRHGRMKPGPRKCQNPKCGKVFTPQFDRARYCSKKCIDAASAKSRTKLARGGLVGPGNYIVGEQVHGDPPPEVAQARAVSLDITRRLLKRDLRSAGVADPAAAIDDVETKLRAGFEGSTVMLRVPEAALDAFWSKLTVPEKIAIVEQELARQ